MNSDRSPEVFVSRFRAIHTAVAYDILDAMGFPNQALHHAIRPLSRRMRIAGPAYTARGMSCAAGSHAGVSAYQMYREFVPGCVLVLDTGGHSVAGPWGENTACPPGCGGRWGRED